MDKKQSALKVILIIMLPWFILICGISLYSDPIKEICTFDTKECTVFRYYIFKKSSIETNIKKSDIQIVVHPGKWMTLELKPIFRTNYIEEYFINKDIAKIKSDDNGEIVKYNTLGIYTVLVLIILFCLMIKYPLE